MRIVVGGLLQESNTFSEASSTLQDFRKYYFRLGEQLLQPQTAENELTGFIRAAAEEERERAGKITLLPTMFAQAVSSGRVPRRTLDELKQLLTGQLARLPSCDGILFALHGAWAAEDHDDADVEIIEELRRWAGPDVPIVITLDSHANVTGRMVRLVDGIVGYRTFPHVDCEETGYRAAKQLFRIIRGKTKPHLKLKKVPMIVPAESHQTYRGPMYELWEEARAGEREDPSRLTSLFLVQPWLDIEEMGCSVIVQGDDPDRTEAEADRLAGLMWSKRSEFEVDLYSVPDIIRKLEADPDRSLPYIVSDSADSPGAGSPGDSNFVLRRLLELGADRRWNCLLSMLDPDSAAAAVLAGEGSAVKLRLGHSVSRSVGEPLDIEAVVATVGTGKFRFGGGTANRMEADMGRCAVVRIGTISLLLMENATFTGDPAMYRSAGLEPAEADLVLVKSANQFRAEYEKLSDRIYILDTPGASTAKIKSLAFERIPRPMVPFDENFAWPAREGESTDATAK
ncbi:M81 family metallopeptidase [Paenibacillus oceani]|uniref:M81 family metallopeptidase n=1 Tax=Paenibacillus oceani TaxID=2772510 RepID=A0A927H3B8_9BACL|nr:M81 family metallopeptidase [Paenibacillus oceani]MBD2866690.1 M81 family metallopeptidase [Paenibacillus oceani]